MSSMLLSLEDDGDGPPPASPSAAPAAAPAAPAAAVDPIAELAAAPEDPITPDEFADTPPAPAAPAPAAPAPAAKPVKKGPIDPMAEVEASMTPAEKAKLARAKKLPKDPTEILLDSVVTTPSSYTAWTPSDDAPPPSAAMSNMLHSLDDGPSFLSLRVTHRMERTLKSQTQAVLSADLEATKPAIQVLEKAAEDSESGALRLLAEKLKGMPEARASKFLHSLEAKMRQRAPSTLQTAESAAAADAHVALLEKERAVAEVEGEWNTDAVGWPQLESEARAVGSSFAQTADACSAASQTLTQLRPQLVQDHPDAHGAIMVNVDLVLAGLSRMQERMSTGGGELMAAAKLVAEAGTEGAQRREALLQSLKSKSASETVAVPQTASRGEKELSAVSFAAALLP